MPRQKKQQLKKRADGRYACRYKDQWFYSFESADDAIAQREAYKQAEKRGDVLRSDVTLAEYGNAWLPIAHPKVADSTYRGLAIHLEKLIKNLGDERMADIKPLQIRQVFTKEYFNASQSYILSGKQLFTALFDSAVESDICKHNPVRSKDAQPHKGTIGGHRAITEQEREWILTYCKDHRAYPAIITMLYAGLRPQEAKALNIDRDVDFQNGIIHIAETAHYDGNNKYQITEQGKTKNAIRDIPLLPPVREALTGRHGLLITSLDGKQCTPSIYKKIMLSYKHQMETAINGREWRWYGRTKEDKALIADGGKLPDFVRFTVVPYDLRHSFCTMCRDNGVELNTCVRWMGHADATMILKIYDEANENRSQREAMKLEMKLFGSQNGSQAVTQNAGNVINKAV